MLELKVRDGSKEVVLQFEHSLLSLSKWEAKHKKPFMSTVQKLPSEMIDYFQDMLLSPEVDRDLVYALNPEQLDDLTKYIADPQSASSVRDGTDKGQSGEVVTSELIYYWLVALQIPFQPTETWHLNRVMMLVRIANFKQQPEKKRPEGEVMSQWAALNEKRKKMFNTKG